MKRILFITPFVPGKTEGGGAAYTYELINELSKDNRVDLLYFRYKDKCRYKPDNDNVKVIAEYIVDKWQKILSILVCPFFFPLFTARFRWSIVRMINKLVRENKYDYCYFDFSQTFSYSRFITHPNKILMSHDVIAQKYSRMDKFLYTWAKLSEGRLLRTGRIIFTFSEKDSGLIRSFYGLDSQPTTFFLSDVVRNAIPKEIGQYYVMFGSWGRAENYETLEWVMDNIDTILTKGERIVVVGGGNVPENIRQRMESIGTLEFIGFLENPYDIIANAKAEIVPLQKGAGVKVKCIEALACGTPVVGTEIAFEGIPKEYGSFMYLAKNPREYREVLSSLDIKIQERIIFKNHFIDSYNRKNIIQYINS